ncbi:hypothetical protein QJS04_geneDACA000449 [Acorus gramineus]|uniref:Uncharacterized protein n=1 Tax=Acorus gramineus TaxID=55184 RepID=A0AAV9APU6_ACOGR|nr:hypothetical protein QJS04_geneDACA000449 [Acorus gramineus]
MEAHMAPEHGHIYEEDPRRLGPCSVIEGEQEHHEKKSVLKKVKDKAKKIKDTLRRRGHGHDSHDPKADEHQEEHYEDETVEQYAEVHRASLYESAAAHTFLEEGQGEHLERSLHVEFPSDPKNQTKGAEVVPVVVITQSFQEMKVSSQPEKTEDSSTTQETLPTIQEKPDEGEALKEEPPIASYAEKISSTASAITASAASVVYEVVAGKAAQGPGEYLSPGEEEKALSEVISEAVHERDEGVVTSLFKEGK